MRYNKIQDLKVKVTIEFKKLGNISETKKWNGSFGNKDKDVNTYLRFLFRLYSFLKAFNWVSISNKSNEEELARFAKIYEEALKNKKITNNYPISKSSYDEKKGQEHVIEKIFSQTSKGSQYLRKLYKNIYPDDTLKCMYDQLPNGLFNTDVNGKPHEKNRIFTSGAYDIWGIDDKNDFCIFELKKNKGNAGLGVISELFFYAVFAKEILCNKDRTNASTKKCRELRGYNKLYDFSQTNKVNEVRAIFLLGEGVHPAIKEMYEKGKLLEVLNTNKFGIKFNFLQYDYDKVLKIKEEMKQELENINK